MCSFAARFIVLYSMPNIAFSAVGWKSIPPVKTVVGCCAGVVICLEQGADLHTAQLMPLSLTVSCFRKSRSVLPFWYWLTQVVQEKGPLNGCVCTLYIKIESSFRLVPFNIQMMIP